MHISYIFSAALITLASASVIPDLALGRRQGGSLITYRNCLEWEQRFLDADFNEMQMLAKKAAEHVDSGNPIFTGFFGKQPFGTYMTDDRIKKRYIAISNFKSNPRKDLNIICRAEKVPACGPANHILAADKGGANIYICNSYWFTRKNGVLRKMSPHTNPQRYRPLDEYISVGAQLLHELTHAWFSTEDHRVLNQASRRPEGAYGHKNTLLLASSNPQQARENADNYKLFAIASYFDRSTWSVDPNKLSAGEL